jgi:hypothetical protein
MDEMGKGCSTHGEGEKKTQRIGVGEPEKERPVVNVKVDFGKNRME